MNASLNARPPAIAPPPAALLLTGALGGRQLSAARDDDVGDAEALRGLVHAFRMQPAVPGHQPRRPPKERAVMPYGRLGLVSLTLVVGYDMEGGHDPRFDLVLHHLPADFDRRAQLAPHDDAGVRLEQAEHLRR